MKDNLIINKNSFLIIIILFGSFIFQITVLKHIWGIENLSRIFNMTLLLLTSLYAGYSLVTLKIKRKVWFAYILPAWLIVIGVLLNLLINIIQNIPLMGHFGFVLPWVLFLIIPQIVDKKLINYQLLWRYSYYIMLGIIIFGLIDYYLIYFSGVAARVLDTPYGIFLVGKFSILHMLKDGSPHFRFYASFVEAGTLGMMVLPFIAYSFLYKKYLGTFILSLGLYFSSSLGANIALFMFFILFIFIGRKNKKNNFLMVISLIILISTSINYTVPTFIKQIENKGGSRIKREKSFIEGMRALPELFINNGLGMQLYDSTEKATQNKLYTGGNFIPIIYLQNGGIISFVGYCIIVCFSFYDALRILRKKKVIEIEDYVVAISLIIMIPFLVQRTTIWETPLFALLYFPSLLKREMV